MPGHLGRRGRGKLVADSSVQVNLHQRKCAIEQRQTDRCAEDQLVLLREIMGRGQSAARLVTVAWTGNGMFLRAAILFAEQTGRINQTARNRWQPNERQQQRNRCLDNAARENQYHAGTAGAIRENG